MVSEANFSTLALKEAFFLAWRGVKLVEPNDAQVYRPASLYAILVSQDSVLVSQNGISSLRYLASKEANFWILLDSIIASHEAFWAPQDGAVLMRHLALE